MKDYQPWIVSVKVEITCGCCAGIIFMLCLEVRNESTTAAASEPFEGRFAGFSYTGVFQDTNRGYNLICN